jgi:hypothetical protein
METQGAKVIPWTGKGAHASFTEVPALAPIDEVVIVMSDEQLDALGAVFRMSPVRHAMTFEAYLTVRGFARTVE